MRKIFLGIVLCCTANGGLAQTVTAGGNALAPSISSRDGAPAIQEFGAATLSADLGDAEFDVSKPFIQLGHSDSVGSVAFSPNGKYAVSGSRDQTAILWDLQSGDAIRAFKGHAARIAALAFNPKGGQILSTSDDGAIKLWDIHSGNELRSFEGAVSTANTLSLSADGRYAVTLTMNRANVWDIESGKLEKVIEGSYTYSAAISPDGRTVLLGDLEGNITVWDIVRNEKLKTLRGHRKSVATLAFSPDGKTFLSAGHDRKIILWDTETRKPLRSFKGHETPVQYVSFSPKANYVMSRGDGARLWDIQTGRELWSSSNTASIAVSPDEKHILTYDYGGSLQVRDFRTDTVVKVLGAQRGVSVPVAFAANGNDAFTGGVGSAINVWDLRRGRIVRRLSGHERPVTSISRTADDTFLLSGSGDQTLKLWDVRQGTLVRTFPGHPGGVSDVRLTPDGQHAISAGFDATIKIWDVESSELLNRVRVFSPSDAIGGIAFCKLCAVGISADGKYAIVSDRSSTAVWDLQAIQKLRTLGENVAFRSLSFSPDGQTVLAGTLARGIETWDIATAQKLGAYRHTGYGSNNKMVAAAFSPDRKFIVTANDDNTAEVWDVASGETIRSLVGHFGAIGSVAYSPDGTRILTGSHDGSAKLWDAATGEELLTLAAFDDGEWLSITPDGYFDASENGAKYLKILTGPLEVSTIDQYFESFYRPDIVSAAYSGEPVKKPGLRMADVRPAPGIRFVATPSTVSQQQVDVALDVTDNGGGVGQVRLYLDDTLIKTVDGSPSAAGGIQLSIRVPPGEHQLKALAFNRANSMSSKPAVHPLVADYSETQQPNLYLLVIGINEYENPAIALRYAVPDAELFAQTLERHTDGLFGTRKLVLLTSKEQTTKDAIRQAFASMQDISPNDLFVFYVASHGLIDEARYHMITSNVGVLSSRGIQREALGQDELRDLIASVPTTKKVVVLDTCHSGALGTSIQQALLTRGLTEVTAIKVLSRAVGSTILSASTSEQQALEGYKGHGLFTYVLAEGLSGLADADNDGYVKTLEIANYVEDEVPELAEQIFNHAQYPLVLPSGQGFPVVRIRQD